MLRTVPRTPRVVPLPGGSLAKMAKKYAPFSVRNSFQVGTINSNGLEVAEGQELNAMKVFFNNKPTEFRMFGSPEELWDDVQVYIDFQGNNQYFGLDPSIHYNHTLRIYHNQNKTKEYIQKNDIFLYIQNYLLHKDPILKNRVALIMLSYYFKLEEKNLEDTCEFVEFDKKAFDILDSELNKLLADMRKSIRIEAMGLTAAKMLKKFQKLLPLPMSEKEMEALMGVLKHLFSLAQCTQKDAENVSRLMYTYCATLIPGLQKIVKARPQWFLPKSKSHPKSLPIVRVMVDDNAEFVIARELNEAVNVYQKVVCASPEAGYVDVMEMNVALKIWETYGRTMDDIEFIVVPITRTKHCFTPIPNGTGLWCKPSADVLIELLKELFFGSNVFQAPNKKTSETLMYLFDAMSTLMKPDMEEIYLLDNRMIDHIDLLFAQKIQRNNAPKTIRDVGSKGFTAEDVRQELKLLKVDSFFPDVCQHADVVFEKIQKAKRLRTCDMYDAVENCMQLSFFKLLPDFAKFLHCQKACHRVYGLKCDQCDQEKKNPKVQKHYMTFWTQKEDGSRGDKVIKMEILNDKGTEIIVQNIPEPAEAKEDEQDENKDETIQKLTDKMRAVTVVTKSDSSPMKPSSGASTSSEK